MKRLLSLIGVLGVLGVLVLSACGGEMLSGKWNMIGATRDTTSDVPTFYGCRISLVGEIVNVKVRAVRDNQIPTSISVGLSAAGDFSGPSDNRVAQFGDDNKATIEFVTLSSHNAVTLTWYDEVSVPHVSAQWLTGSQLAEKIGAEC